MFKSFFGILLILASIFVFAIGLPPNVAKVPLKTPDLEIRTKIAIIDTGLKINNKIKPFLCKNLSVSLTKSELDFESEHGTNIAGLITENLDPAQFCIVMIKFFDKYNKDDVFDRELQAIKYAIFIKAKFLNMSIHGETFQAEEYNLLSQAINSGMNISVASGNGAGEGPERDANGNVVYKKNLFGNPSCPTKQGSESCRGQIVTAQMGKNLDEGCTVYPACYVFPSTQWHVVGSSTGYPNEYGGIHIYGNYGKQVQFWEDGTYKGNPPMTGTSQATAIHTGKWAAGKIK